jgi:predicted nucleic acid-binding protein
MRVVADTGPLHYLILIDQIELLPRMLGSVSIPAVVRDELDQAMTPERVRRWIANPPPWLAIVPAPMPGTDPTLAALDEGERAAILLAGESHAGLLLMDERAGVAAARARGLLVTGTLGLLDRAARRGLVDLETAVMALRATNFHVRPALLEVLLEAWRKDSDNR